MDLSIIIVSYNSKDVLEKCLDRIRRSDDRLTKEVICSDNSSTDGSAEMVRNKFPEIKLLQNSTNLGFSGANNAAYKETSGDFVLLLNSDAFIGASTLQKTVDFMRATSSCGALGCRLIDAQGRLQPSARSFPTPWRTFLSDIGIGDKFWNIPFLRGIDNTHIAHDSARETDWVPGCFMMLRRKTIDSLTFFFRKDFFMYEEDTDLCLRMKRAGWKVFFYPEDIVHLGGESAMRAGSVTASGKQLPNYQFESEIIYYRKNYGIHYVLLFLLLEVVSLCIETLKDTFRPSKWSRLSISFKKICTLINISLKTRLGNRPTWPVRE